MSNGHVLYEGPSLTVTREGATSYRFAYTDGTTFGLESNGGRVWATWPAPLTVDDTVTYFLGPVLGFILRLQGCVCLHASAVRVGDGIVAFAGASGCGKSTLAARWAQSGYPIVSDDILPLYMAEGQVFAYPGYPRLRLWPDAVSTLYGPAAELPVLTPNWEKRYLDVRHRFQDSPLPLTAIYLLGNVEPEVEVPAAEACWELACNTYSNYLLDSEKRVAELDFISEVARLVPVRRGRPSPAANLPT